MASAITISKIMTRSAACTRVMLKHMQSMGSVSTSEPGVILSQEGSAGIILLNRPKALNALNLDMARTILPQLKEWESNQKVSLIIIKGVGEKAFCAGGDIKAVAEAGKKKHRLAQDFFREEYMLDYAIGKTPPFATVNSSYSEYSANGSIDHNNLAI
uniref:3-hydroxyisobutyryl-CoA hydrolase, mitochondrial-like n=1 Tax=Myxine glutinosa TaxID=7769 RepID=UPI00358EEEF6